KAYDPKRTRRLGWLGLGVSGLFGLLVVAVFVGYAWLIVASFNSANWYSPPTSTLFPTNTTGTPASPTPGSLPTFTPDAVGTKSQKETPESFSDDGPGGDSPAESSARVPGSAADQLTPISTPDPGFTSVDWPIVQD
ncbi:MAG: hypothetical protein GYB65_03430, partial [Chloroflexi bacterium]|nr:hypothetical protein [Chloroflexota bacterium]